MAVEYRSSKRDKTPETQTQHTGTHTQTTPPEEAAEGRAAFIGRQETRQRGTGEAGQVSLPQVTLILGGNKALPVQSICFCTDILVSLVRLKSNLINRSGKAPEKKTIYFRKKKKRVLEELLTAAKLEL